MLTSNVQLGYPLARGGCKLSRLVYLGPCPEFWREWKIYFGYHSYSHKAKTMYFFLNLNVENSQNEEYFSNTHRQFRKSYKFIILFVIFCEKFRFVRGSSVVYVRDF